MAETSRTAFTPPSANSDMVAPGGSGSDRLGILPTDRDLEHTTMMFSLYWEFMDAIDKRTAEHDILVGRKRFLLAGLKQMKELFYNAKVRNLSLALMEPLSTLEEVNRELRVLEADQEKKLESLRRLPGMIASHEILAVNSLRDIRLVRSLQLVFGWKGKVKLVQGGTDPIDKCLDLLREYKIQRVV